MSQVDPATTALPLNLAGRRPRIPTGAQSGGNADQVDGPARARPRADQAFTRPGRARQHADRSGSRPSPVVADGRVYVIDTLRRGPRLRRPHRRAALGQPDSDDKGSEASLYGGGVAYDDGRIYATNGLGDVAALDERNGGIVWKVRAGRTAARRADASPTAASMCSARTTSSSRSRKPTARPTGRQPASLETPGVFGVRLAGGRPGHGGRRLLVGRAQRLSLRERPRRCGRTRCRAPASRPRSRRSPTSTPTR